MQSALSFIKSYGSQFIAPNIIRISDIPNIVPVLLPQPNFISQLKLRKLGKRKYLMRLIYLIPIFIFRPTYALSPECKVYAKGLVLNCVNMDAFPEGSYASVTIAKFSRNNFEELPAYVFANHTFNNVQQAILRHSNIQIIRANAFARMHHLEYLDLYNNVLPMLDPAAFEGLTSLKHLVLAQNQIATVNAAILKPLPSLEALDLSFNRLTDLPTDFIRNAKVHNLQLQGNNLSFSSEAPILESKSLEKLTLRECNLEKLPKNSFRKLRNLTILDLSNNRLQYLQNKLFKPLSKLRFLNIGYNSIEVIDVETFPVPNYIESIRCDKNPLEERQNCSDLLEESKLLSDDSAVNLSDEDMSHTSALTLLNNASVAENSAKAVPPVDERRDQNKNTEIEVLQYWVLIGLSIGLIVLVIIGSLQAFYIVSQSAKSGVSVISPDMLLSEQYQSMC